MNARFAKAAGADRRGPCRRLMIGGLAALALMPVPGLHAAEAASQDEILLRIEEPGEIMRQMRGMPATAKSFAELRKAKIAPETVKALEAAVAQTYDPEVGLQAIRTALAGLPDAPRTDSLAAAAERFVATRRTLEDASGKAPEALAQDFETRWQKRPDKARIDELVGLMGIPESWGEIRLTGARMERALELPVQGDLKKIKAAGATELAAEIDRELRTTRADPGQPGYPLSQSFGRMTGTGFTKGRLVLLSEGDVKTLYAFYAGKEGRAKRKALVESLARWNDESAKAMLTAFIRVLKAEP